MPVSDRERQWMDVLFAYVGMSITEKGNTLDTKGKHQTMVNKVQGGLSPPAHQEGGLVGEGEDCDRQGDVRPVAGAEAPHAEPHGSCVEGVLALL